VQLLLTSNRTVEQSKCCEIPEHYFMDLPMELSLEQKFNLKMYEEQVKALSHEEAQKFLLEVLRQLMVKDNMLKHFMKQAV
jgi:hypothetical protein